MNLTLQQKVGQKLVTGFPGKELDASFIKVVKKYKIGNVILFKENVEDEAQLVRLCQEIQTLVLAETGLPAFITVDQEGGMVCRMPETAANVPGAMAVAATGDKRNAYLSGLATAREMRYFGMNFDLAPVVDVNSNPQNPIIGVRSFGDTPEQVIEYSLEMMRGLAEGGVLASVKHFPGHGDTAVDSHLALPKVEKSYEELCREELLPFIAAIKAGVPAVTTTHILFPALDDSGKPATMSRPILTGLLREKLGFRGMIVSDCMEMKAIADYFGTIEGTIEAVKAGVDLVYISHNAPLAGEACKAIEEAVLQGTISRQELDESVERILSYKLKIPKKKETYDRQEAKQLALSLLQKSLCLVQEGEVPFILGANPISLGCPAVRITLVGNVEDSSKTFAALMADCVGGAAFDYPVDPADEDIKKAVAAVKGHSSVIIGSYNAHLREGQQKLIEAVAEMGIPVAVVALRNPYDLFRLNKKAMGLAVFEYTKQAVEAASKVLTGERKAEGKMPIRVM